jgi:hypothetical protein
VSRVAAVKSPRYARTRASPMPRSFALGNVTGSACRLTDREWSSHLLARSPGHRSRRQAVASRANQFLIATGRKAYQERVGTRSCGGTRARRRATFETGAVWWPEAGGVRHLRLFVSRTQSRDSRRAAHAQGRARADEDDSAKPLLERKAMVTCRELQLLQRQLRRGHRKRAYPDSNPSISATPGYASRSAASAKRVTPIGLASDRPLSQSSRRL